MCPFVGAPFLRNPAILAIIGARSGGRGLALLPTKKCVWCVGGGQNEVVQGIVARCPGYCGGLSWGGCLCGELSGNLSARMQRYRGQYTLALSTAMLYLSDIG